MATDNRVRHHVLVFDDPEKTLDAVKRLRGSGFEIEDVHSPFPVHGLDEAMGWRPTRLGYATLFGGAAGLGLGLLLQIWTHTSDWPLNIGGKTNLAGPALVPVVFELTVLCAAFATVGALFFKGRLFPGGGAKPARQPLSSTSDDELAVLVVERDGGFDPAVFERLVKTLRPKAIHRHRRPE